MERALSPLQGTIYPYVARGKDFVVEIGSKPDRHRDFLLPPLVRIRKRQPGIQALVITRQPEDIKKTGQLFEDVLRRRSGKQAKGRLEVLQLGQDHSVRREAAQVARGPDIVVGSTERVIDHIRRENIDLGRVRVCVIDEPEAEAAQGFNADLEYIYTKFSRTPQTAVFVRDYHEQVTDVVSLLRRPTTISMEAWLQNGGKKSQSEEGRAVSIKSFVELRKDEALKKRMQEVLREIHEDEDPDELNAYKRVLKKNVPLFSRAYFAAYLLKYLHQGQLSGGGKGKKSKDDSRPFQSIFVSVGKNRKVFPKDLVQLFTNVDSIGSDDIGQIRILDNYSFVEVTESKAVTAIEGLNGTEFRGRKLTVNYARKKENN